MSLGHQCDQEIANSRLANKTIFSNHIADGDSISGHVSPVRAVKFITVDEEQNATFASVSHDQTLVLYQYKNASNTVEYMNVGKGHARSVDCLAVDPSKQYIATGSFDSTLNIWGAKLTNVDEEVKQSEVKKAKNDKAPTRTPLITLVGHKEGISGVTYMETPTDVITASWDHTLRLWDAETSSLKTELVGNKAFLGLAYSPEKKMILTAACERTIRMYDPRSTDGLIVKSAYSSHQVNSNRIK